MQKRIWIELPIVFLPLVPAAWLASSAAGDNPLGRQAIIWVAYVTVMGLIWLALRRDGKDYSHIGARFARASTRTIALTVAQGVLVFLLAAMAFAAGAVLMGMILGRPEPANFDNLAYLQGNPLMLLVSLAGVYVVSSFGEEVLFRGYLMTRLAEALGGEKRAWRFALLISAVVFALIHYDWGLAGMVQTGLMGLVLAWAFLRFGQNLWVNVIAHGIMDTILLLQIYLA